MAGLDVHLLVATLIGALVGLIQLVGRYRDAPGAALVTWPAGLYLLINASASAVALGLIRLFGWTFGTDPSASSAAGSWAQVIVAGAGAVAVLRTAIIVHADDRAVPVGLSSLL